MEYLVQEVYLGLVGVLQAENLELVELVVYSEWVESLLAEHLVLEVLLEAH